MFLGLSRGRLGVAVVQDVPHALEWLDIVATCEASGVLCLVASRAEVLRPDD